MSTKRHAFALLAAASLTGGCNSFADGSVRMSGEASGPSPSTVPPEGAVAVADDVYMVPAGVDELGCMMYTAWSPTRAVITVIQYRTAEGGFSPLRDEADCGE